MIQLLHISALLFSWKIYHDATLQVKEIVSSWVRQQTVRVKVWGTYAQRGIWFTLILNPVTNQATLFSRWWFGVIVMSQVLVQILKCALQEMQRNCILESVYRLCRNCSWNWVEFSLKLVNSANPINHWSMNWGQFKYPFCYLV